VKQNYQTIGAAVQALAMPESVSVAIGEVVADVGEGLLAMAVGAGLQVMVAMMDADVATVCGPKGKHDPDRTAVRHGSGRGSVTLGGRRVPIARPRMRAMDGSGELPVASYELFTSTEMLGRMAMAKMLAGISTRRWQVGLEPVGEQVDQVATATSKSAVSRRFVQATETALSQLLARPLADLELVALLLDGVHFGEHVCVVALGIGIDGTKHPLALVDGDTENTTVVTDLLVGLRDRGLDTTRPILVVIDGAKALRAAVTRVLDHPVIARCQLPQAAQRHRPATEPPRWDPRQADAPGLPGQHRAGGPSSAPSADPTTPPHPPRRGRPRCAKA
jgi:transposase-like protein